MAEEVETEQLRVQTRRQIESGRRTLSSGLLGCLRLSKGACANSEHRLPNARSTSSRC